MSYQFCLIHREVSAWGCSVCRKEALALACEEAVEEARKAIRAAFRATPLNKDTSHG